MKKSQKTRRTQAKNQLKGILKNVAKLEDSIAWYDAQLTAFKEIEPGCNNAYNLEVRLNAWKNIVPGCDTPQKLAEHIAKLEKNQQKEQVDIPEEQSLFERWNNEYVPYCKDNGIPKISFASETEYLAEESDFLKDIREYENPVDPHGFVDFFKWLNNRNITLPRYVEEIL